MKILILAVGVVMLACTFDKKEHRIQFEQQKVKQKKHNITVPQQPVIDSTGKTIQTRFEVPAGFERIRIKDSSFGAYLRDLPLKKDGAPIMYFDGTEKKAIGAHASVVDLPIGKRDLHQCADNIMRLRAEYLWKNKIYDSIHFNFVNGFKAEYSKWRQGQRIKVQGNKSWWVDGAQPSDDYESFWKYLEMVFSFAGTLSLEKELKPVSIDEIQIGDVFIQGGSPGHAIIVVDIAQHTITKEKMILLAQSFMPAQETHVLNNFEDVNNSPWYSLNASEANLYTPNWNFSYYDLKRFE